MLSKIGIIGLITVLILLAFLGCGEEQNPVSGSGNSQSSFKDSMAKAKIGSFAEIKQQSLQQQYVSLQQIMDKYPILDKFFHSIENVKGNGQSSDIYRDLPTKELIMSEVNKAGGYDKYLIALSQLELTHGTANDKANWAQNHGVYAAPSATTQAENPWDVNKDQVVNILDLVEVARHFGEKIEGESPPYDINKDGVVNILDLVLVGTHFGEKYQAQWVQPATGPGGRDYRYAEVTKQVYNEGTGEEYWIFEPASPTPASAPLILFNHGWGALKPDVYGAWIKHLVRRGNIVVYPRYQEDLLTSMKEFTPNALAAVKAALIELQKGPHVRPELNHFAIVGHSIGGALTASLAALAASEGLPQPKAIMSVAPGNFIIGHPNITMPMADLHQIPATTLMLVVIGADDDIVGDILAKPIFDQTPQISLENKDFIIMVSDNHGDPPLIADHFASLAPDKEVEGGRPGGQAGVGTIDALDYYGYWKLFDALIDAAFNGTNRKYALGNTPEERYMGSWPDGTPVKEPTVTDSP